MTKGMISTAVIVLLAILGTGCPAPNFDEPGNGGDDTPHALDSTDGGETDAATDSVPVTDAPALETLDAGDQLGDMEIEVSPCEPDCADKECGDDGCGGQCKTTCWAHEVCFAWKCREEGEVGFPCTTDEECDEEHCVDWLDDSVCTVFCNTVSDCEDPEWTCEAAYGSTFCLPPCEPLTCEAVNAECGAPADGCYSHLDCGECGGANQVCGIDWICACQHEECSEACCDEGEVCHDGGCWFGPIPCVPDCPDGQHCTDGECIPCCGFGEICGGGVVCDDGLVCNGGVCCSPADATCDGIDDDCDGSTDEDYEIVDDCGTGPCQENNIPSSCVDAMETLCQPGQQIAIDDVTCDGVDDDCDGLVDEDWVTDATCGVGPCLEGNVPSSCGGGVETPCVPGFKISEDDETCDGVDDDCDGAVDEDYQVVDDCGVGWCQINATPSSCVDGIEALCQPGPAGDDETACNGIDDDCDGSTDEDYLLDISCGVGACLFNNVPSSCVGGVETPCIEGEAAEQDVVCNDLDDDCDGDVDEDYVSDGSCGLGWCLATNVPSVCDDGTEVPCVAGQPLVSLDLSCDSIDSDCDGSTDEDADPPCSFGAPVVGAEVLFDSEGGLPSGIVTDNGDGTYSTTIIGLVEPGFEGTVGATVGEVTAAPAGFTAVSGGPASTTLHLSRSLLTPNMTQLRCCLFTADSLGAPAGPGLAAGCDLDVGGYQSSADATYVGDGFYCGWIETYPVIFDEASIGGVSAWIEGLVTETESVEVLPTPDFGLLDEGEVAITLPLGPVEVGTEFVVPVVTNTEQHLLAAYNLAVTFDTEVLEVLSVDKGATEDLGAPLSNVEIDANETGKLSFNAINENSAGGTAMGPAIELALITFAVRADATPGATATVSGDVYELVDTLYEDFSASDDMTIQDLDGSGILGVVEVDQAEIVAIQPVLAPPVVMDLSVFTGEVPTASVEVLAFRTDGSLSLVTAEEGIAECGVDDVAVATEAECLLIASGPGMTEVTASMGNHSGDAMLRVATLDPDIEATVLDPLLQYILELDAVQTTSVRVIGTVSDGAFIEYTLDLTQEVDFQSTHPEVVTVSPDGEILPGINGQAEINVMDEDGTVVASATVDVAGSEVVQIADLLLVIPAFVEMEGLSPEPVPTITGQALATAKVTNLMTGEGQTVQTRAYLIFSDDDVTGGGSRMDITGSESLGMQAGIEGIGTVDEAGVLTAHGEGQTEVYAVFTDAWGDTSKDDTQPFSVEMPPPVSVEVSVLNPRISVGIDDRAWTVLGLPYQRALQVEVFFDDGSSLQLADDLRTHYEVTGDILTIPGVVDCYGFPDCTPGVVSATGTGTGTETITVTFPDTYLEGLVGTIDIEVVGHSSLFMESLESYTPEGAEPVAETFLTQIEGSGIWQDAALKLTDTFTDGSSMDLTAYPDSEFHVYIPGTTTPKTGVVLVSGNGSVTAQGAGTVHLVGEHQGVKTVPIALGVQETPTDIIAIAGFLEDDVLAGVKDQAHETLLVYGLLSDGTRRVLTGSGNVYGLLTFTAMDDEIATVNASGVVTARGNGLTVVTIDVNPVWDVGTDFDPPTLASVPVNLTPALGDIDLGEPFGNPFPDQPAEAIFEMPVRLNTGGYLLGGLDAEISYDPEVLTALGVAKGVGIGGSVFNANTGEAGTIYLNMSPLLGQSGFGEELEVARITFKALKGPGGPMVTPISGVIRAVVDTSGNPLGADTPRPIVAGAGMLDPPPAIILGDANDDEIFDVRDVLFLQRTVAVPPLVIPNLTQEAQSDIFSDGLVDMKDAYFGSQVLARLAHFVGTEAVVTTPGEYDLKAWLVDRDQQLVHDSVAVSFEIMPGNSLEEIQFTLSHEATQSGLITEGLLLGDGSWGTHVSGLVSEEAMGVVVILDVMNGQGQTMRTTTFMASPFTEIGSLFEPVISFGAVWCVPDCDLQVCGGADGCGGTCHGPCASPNEVCHEGVCVCAHAACGVGCCAQGEVCDLVTCCPPDSCASLGAICGERDDGCGGTLSCGTCGDFQTCINGTCECSVVECDGICCEEGQACEGGVCACVPQCDDKFCGADDGCGGACDGPCVIEDAFCNNGACKCIYASCGSLCCGDYEECQGEECVPLCTPDCTDKSCGDDNGCGDLCDGPCPGEYEFCEDGQCACFFVSCGEECCGENEECNAGTCI